MTMAMPKLEEQIPRKFVLQVLVALQSGILALMEVFKANTSTEADICSEV